MKTIHKFTLSIESLQAVHMPEGSQILSIQCQNNQPQIWASIDTRRKMVLRSFVLYGTGHEMRYFAQMTQKHVGTIQLFGGELVFHIFELIEEE